MLFEAADDVRLEVVVKYIDSQAALKEKTLSNGDRIFLAEPGKEFEFFVTSVGAYEGKLGVCCFVGTDLQSSSQSRNSHVDWKSLYNLVAFSV